MANTGYKINPQVIQVFTTGPSSGSIVDPSFTVTFDSGSGFTSSSLCNQSYYYRVYDPIGCAVAGVCATPVIHSSNVLNCEDGYDYIYQFNIEAGTPPTGSYNWIRMEYSLTSDFSGEVKGVTITDYTGSIINPLEIRIEDGTANRTYTSGSGLVGLPINQYAPVYFRAYSICSGSVTSSYSSIEEVECVEPPASFNMSLYHFKTSIPVSELNVYVDSTLILESELSEASAPSYETTLTIPAGSNVYVVGTADNPDLNAEAELIAQGTVVLGTIAYDHQIHPNFSTATISFVMPSEHIILTSNNS